MLKMSEEKEQHVCIKVCIKCEKNGVKTFEMLETAFDDEYSSHACTSEWFKRFKEG
jgi:hypothetical protein